MRNNILLIAMREVAEKVRNRAFLLFTLFMLLLPIGGGVIGVFVSDPDTREYRVGLSRDGSEQLAPVLKQQAKAFSAEVETEQLRNPEAAETALRNGEVDAAVTDLDRVLTDDAPGTTLETILRSSTQQFKSVSALRGAGVSPNRARAILNPEPPSFSDISGDEEDGAMGPGAAIAQIGMVFLFLTIFTYGYWIANGIVEEKSSRVVEIVLSTIRPAHLLSGKILGIGLLGLCQILLVAGLGLAAASIAGLDMPSVAFGILGAVVLWFLLGYAFYSCLFAVAGSLVSKQEDLQYTQLPLMVLIFGGYGAAFYEFGNPGSLVGQILSFIPPFSPMVMLMRMGLGGASAWEVMLAAVLTLAATVGLMFLAVRLYAGSVLRFGTRVSLADAWKPARK